MEGPRPDVRRESTDQVVHILHPQAPVDHQILASEFRSISCIKTVLLGENDSSGGNRRQNLYYSFSSEVCENFGEFATVHVGCNVDWALEGYGAGIESLVHSRDCHAGLALSVHYCAFYRGRSAVSWEERSVHVPGAESGGVERLRAQDLAVGCDDECVVV